MALSSSYAKTIVSLVFSILIICNIHHANGCFTSMFSFGDSLTDTGNLLNIELMNGIVYYIAYPPYGQSFFHVSTGRFSDGRIIMDFIAEAVGLPYLPPYFGDENGGSSNFEKGVNLAVGGARAIDYSFWIERGFKNASGNVSLGDELGYFKNALQSLCSSPSDCKRLLKTSLIIMGEIGGNDYNHPLTQGSKIDEVRGFVPLVVDTIASAINELIELGAVTILVPGIFPNGCFSAYLTYFESSDKEDYDPLTGCLTWMNQLSQYHNQMLQKKLDQLRKLHPHVNIMYADYYNTAIRLFQSPAEFGFNETQTLIACCGKGGRYNYVPNTPCGGSVKTCCDDPSSSLNWDGYHLTEAAYKLVAKPIIQQLSSFCLSFPTDNHTSSISSS